MAARLKLNLSPYYINTRRINSILGCAIPVVAQTSIVENSGERAAAMDIAARFASTALQGGTFPLFTEEMLDRVRGGEPTLAQLWQVFTFKNVGSSVTDEELDRRSNGEFRSSITVGGQQVEVRGTLTTEHHYSVSTASELSGRKRMLVAGKLEWKEDHIELSPYVVGDLFEATEGDFSLPWRSLVRVHPEQIEEFEKCKDARRATRAEIDLLGKVAEEDVKTAFAEIIEEPFVPKDWGGEKSDLQTNHLSLDGTPCAAVFVFKGKGTQGELHPADLGKRGDQIHRAFDEPVDLVIIQYHHKIANTVVRESEAFASDPRRPRRFCILDGADTVRILRSYNKFDELTEPLRSGNDDE